MIFAMIIIVLIVLLYVTNRVGEVGAKVTGEEPFANMELSVTNPLGAFGF